MRRSTVVDRIANLMKLNFPEVETILYGSEARGTARTDSDIDLLMLLPNEEPSIELKQRINDSMYDIELEKLVSISTVFFSKREWGKRRTPFYINVTNEGIRL